ncbi:MAG: MBL fold metallo-hydrolase [Salinivirgaceae bacterium]|nr:MBL fold metallo-hydrolase [Salinivirgaceae bacterium]
MNALKISILSDKSASSRCRAEHGLSFVVEADRRILFDTGASDLFMENARIMGVDIDNIETVVLSHGHYDHGNGMRYLCGKTIVAHPGIFAQRISGASGRNISIEAARADIEAHGNRFVLTREPLWLSKQIVFLGEIPRAVPFENEGRTQFHFTDGQPDVVADDSALAVKTDKGLVVVSGCAHSGICNIVEQARKVTGEQVVYGVIGGFHLKHADVRLQATIDFLKQLEVKIVMPSHCTGIAAQCAFYQAFGGNEVKTGLQFDF